MTELQKHWGMGLALGGGVIVVLLLLGHSAAVANAVAAPDVPNPSKVPDNHFELPDYPPINLGNITFNTAPPAAAPSCSCGCESTNQFLPQFQALADEYDKGIKALLGNFSDALLASVPKYNGGTFDIEVPYSTFANMGV